MPHSSCALYACLMLFLLLSMRRRPFRSFLRRARGIAFPRTSMTISAVPSTLMHRHFVEHVSLSRSKVVRVVDELEKSANRFIGNVSRFTLLRISRHRWRKSDNNDENNSRKRVYIIGATGCIRDKFAERPRSSISFVFLIGASL